SGDVKTHPATPAFFSTQMLNFHYDPSPPRPEGWLKFLSDLWPNDPESVALLQEWAGYLLTADTRQQKILIPVRPRRIGQGTSGKVLRELVGRENAGSPTLSSLAGPFGLWPLLDKRLAVFTDARLSGRTDTAQVVENLLRVSGEDAVDVHRKNLP